MTKSTRRAASGTVDASPEKRLVRVYHPTLNTYYDVDNSTDTIGEWVEQGWEKTPGDHIDSSTFPPLSDDVNPVALVVSDAPAGGTVTSTPATTTARSPRSGGTSSRGSAARGTTGGGTVAPATGTDTPSTP